MIDERLGIGDMSKSSGGFIGFMWVRRRSWLPLVILTVLLFGAAVFLSDGRQVAPFLYRLF
jgi:hypothetical protein